METHIKQLYLHNFRNLNNSLLEFTSGVNVFIGDNAEGKTNVLESLYYSLHSKSFKHCKLEDIITNGYDHLITQVKVGSDIIDIHKTTSSVKITLNKQNINAISISQLVPTQVISPDKGYVVGGSNIVKRSVLNWGVFHVEPSFKPLFFNYIKIQKNINILIKNNNISELKLWIEPLAKHIYLINSKRVAYLKQLTQLPKIECFNNEDIDPSLLTCSFHSGIPKGVEHSEESIRDFLIKNVHIIIKNKYLKYGPHSAYLEFWYNNTHENNLSRGQQKTLSLLFWLSQLCYLINIGKHPVVLLDDISSELGNKKVEIILRFLKHYQIQSFITNITHLDGENHTTYFVKSGKVEYN